MQASPLDPFHVFLCASFDILLVPVLVCVFCLNGIVWLAFGFLSQCAFVLFAFSCLSVWLQIFVEINLRQCCRRLKTLLGQSRAVAART